MKDLILDGDNQRDLSNIVVSENKSGSMTINGRSPKQIAAALYREKGKDAYDDYMASVEEFAEINKTADKAWLDSQKQIIEYLKEKCK